MQEKKPVKLGKLIGMFGGNVGVAKILGCSQNRVSRIKNGHTILRYDEGLKLSQMADQDGYELDLTEFGIKKNNDTLAPL
jgi:hypothetical protein